MTVRRGVLIASLELYLPLGGLHYAARRYTKTDTVLIFLHFYATANPPAHRVLAHFQKVNSLNSYIIATLYPLWLPILITSLS